MQTKANNSIKRIITVFFMLIISGKISVQGQTDGSTNRFYSLEDILVKWRPLPINDVVTAAEKGELTAQHYLGYYHMTGAGGLTNETEGLKWYRLAAAKGFPNAENNLGVAYLRGNGVGQDIPVAIQWFERAMGHGFFRAAANLVQLMQERIYPIEKYAELRLMLEEGAKRSNPDAAVGLANLLRNPPAGLHYEYDNALYWYKKAFGLGRRDVCYEIGDIYYRNDQFELAAAWYQRGGDLGDNVCKCAMAWCLFLGKGVEVNPELAIKMSTDLALSGHGPAAYNLARFYAHENLPSPSPIPMDLDKARIWYRKGAEKGHVQSMYMLGFHIRHDQSSQETDNEGVGWLVKASLHGNSDAKRELAASVLNSPGAIPDGWRWIEAAAMDGYYTEFQFAMARHVREGEDADLLQSALWTLEANYEEYRSPWVNVAGVDSEGKLLPQTKGKEREFAETYIALIQAGRNRQASFFKMAGQAYERGEGRPKSLVFGMVCYELAGMFGDAEAKQTAEALRLRLDVQQKKDASRWLGWLKAENRYVPESR